MKKFVAFGDTMCSVWELVGCRVGNGQVSLTVESLLRLLELKHRSGMKVKFAEYNTLLPRRWQQR